MLISCIFVKLSELCSYISVYTYSFLALHALVYIIVLTFYVSFTIVLGYLYIHVHIFDTEDFFSCSHIHALCTVICCAHIFSSTRAFLSLAKFFFVYGIALTFSVLHFLLYPHILYNHTQSYYYWVPAVACLCLLCTPMFTCVLS